MPDRLCAAAYSGAARHIKVAKERGILVGKTNGKLKEGLSSWISYASLFQTNCLAALVGPGTESVDMVYLWGAWLAFLLKGNGMSNCSDKDQI